LANRVGGLGCHGGRRRIRPRCGPIASGLPGAAGLS